MEPFECVRMRKDGKRIEIESTFSPIVDAAGELVAVSSIARDITDRKRSQALATGQAQLLEFIAAGAALPRVLDRLASFVEEHAEGVLASILLLDRDGSAPLPRGCAEPAGGLLRGDRRAADRAGRGVVRHGRVPRERVCVSDIAHDPALGRLPRAGRGGRAARLLVGPHLRDRRRAARDVRAVLPARPATSAPRRSSSSSWRRYVAGIAIEGARSEEAARDSEERYRDLFENASEPIATVTMDETITEVNGAFARVLGYSREELLGSNLGDYLTPEGLETSRLATERKIAGKLSSTTFEQEFLAKDGHLVILEVSSRVIVEDGRPIGVQGICRDVTARKQAEIELRRLSELNRHQALHDDLTGLPNRACFGQQVEHAIHVADRDGSQLAVLLMDLDRFKEINDTLGHRYGDLLLVELARRLETGAASQRHRRPPRRRRVRHPRASALGRQRPRARARPHPRRARSAVPRGRPAAARRGQRRRRAVPGARARRRRAAEAR